MKAGGLLVSKIEAALADKKYYGEERKHANDKISPSGYFLRKKGMLKEFEMELLRRQFNAYLKKI